MRISRRLFVKYGVATFVGAPFACYARSVIEKMRRNQDMASYTVSIAKNDDPASAVRRSMASRLLST